MGFPLLQGEARDGRTRPERVTGVMGQWAGKGHRGDRAAWVEVGDPGLIRASDSSAKKGADANAQPPGSAQTRGNRQLFRDCYLLCVHRVALPTFLPPFVLGRFQNASGSETDQTTQEARGLHTAVAR